MQAMAPYQRRIILALVVIILAGLILIIIDRQRQATSFDVRGFLDGYKHTSIVDTSKAVVTAETNALKLPKSENSTKSAIEIGKININNADVGQLQLLPGIGPVLAQRIIAYRDSIGAFNDLNDLLMVKGIGQRKLLRMQEYIEF
jgi:competence ComEA-like helix-hairpin-helix protein